MTDIVKRLQTAAPINFPLGALCSEAADTISALTAERDALLAALTPSAETKAAYIGEFTMPFLMLDEDGNGKLEYPYVPWTTIKEIMAVIRARAAVEKVKRRNPVENDNSGDNP